MTLELKRGLTVGDVIDNLSQFPRDATFEFGYQGPECLELTPVASAQGAFPDGGRCTHVVLFVWPKDHDKVDYLGKIVPQSDGN
jgi:hypothetical protein